ncbi:hypothetical protein IFM89_015123 [Coptis chinensis]|uniref:Uncharacterized protein n=1 Tax=Coptis chinensis TaxID=261450 RepID=A0A835IRB3_9MAGN|nr:hypothetical protein IFM89_015123 [Coptis chinensis]
MGGRIQERQIDQLSYWIGKELVHMFRLFPIGIYLDTVGYGEGLVGSLGGVASGVEMGKLEIGGGVDWFENGGDQWGNGENGGRLTVVMVRDWWWQWQQPEWKLLYLLLESPLNSEEFERLGPVNKRIVCLKANYCKNISINKKNILVIDEDNATADFLESNGFRVVKTTMLETACRLLGIEEVPLEDSLEAALHFNCPICKGDFPNENVFDKHQCDFDVTRSEDIKVLLRIQFSKLKAVMVKTSVAATRDKKPVDMVLISSKANWVDHFTAVGFVRLLRERYPLVQVAAVKTQKEKAREFYGVCEVLEKPLMFKETVEIFKMLIPKPFRS